MEGTGGTKMIDKDKLIVEQQARIGELERLVEELKGMEMTYMKQSNDDLRRASEMMMAAMRVNPAGREGKVRKKNLFG